jgi:hypothetical protein
MAMGPLIYADIDEEDGAQISHYWVGADTERPRKTLAYAPNDAIQVSVRR